MVLGVPITAFAIKDLFYGKEKKSRGILEVFEEHNAKVDALVGTEFAENTLQRYEVSLRHTRNFIKSKYATADLMVKLFWILKLPGVSIFYIVERLSNILV